MSLSEYILLAGSSLFVIVDPLATVPAFLAMTPTDTPEQRIRMARLACCVMAGVLIVFAAAGQLIFKFLGITMPAFQIAASIVLLLVALDMLRAQRSRVQETSEETAASAHRDTSGLQIGAGRLATDRGRLLDAPQRPTESPQRQNLLLFGVAQDIAHGGERTCVSRRRQRLGCYARWPVFRCPSMAGFGCPPRA